MGRWHSRCRCWDSDCHVMMGLLLPKAREKWYHGQEKTGYCVVPWRKGVGEQGYDAT